MGCPLKYLRLVAARGVLVSVADHAEKMIVQATCESWRTIVAITFNPRP